MAQTDQKVNDFNQKKNDKYIDNNSGNPTLQMFTTCLRIKYPIKTLNYFINNFSMVLLYKNSNNITGFTNYYLISSKSGVIYPLSNSIEAETLLWNYKGGVLQLKYKKDDDKNANFVINSGNIKPFRGFGHIAFNTNDVYKSCAELQKNGVTFKKKPNDGRMKGLAFAYDPNGYWIEIVSRTNLYQKTEKYNLSQTMIRIKDPKKSVKFYSDILGMRLIKQMHFEKGKFSLFFMSSYVNNVDINNMDNLLKKEWNPVIELTWNWGTEIDNNFKYHNGTDNCDLGVGFQNISFFSSNLLGKKYLTDPDGYKIEILQRGKNPF